MKRAPWIIAFSVYVYRGLLCLGPAEFRREYGEPALQVFRQCCRDAYRQRGIAGVVRLWLPYFWDAFAGMLAEQQAVQLRQSWPVLTAFILILFPFYWLSQTWTAFGLIFNSIFATTRAHEIGHVALFCIAALLTLTSLPRLRTHFVLYLLLMLLGAFGEEVLQNMFKLQPLIAIDGHDILLDLLGVVAGYMLFRLWLRIDAGLLHWRV
ncbi:MAG TPA: hypothetical protein VKX46_09490 [Ktedonobacteraceae bacterium]|nr:hypothetical protein [Ktedonobacteraceae bacterium]